ncbi:MAG: hypothetical protein AAGD28_08450 [Bacteroidota bacterium]
MKPPKCSICSKKFSPSKEGGGGVYFKLTEEQQARKKRMKEKRMVGHPPGYHWFCEKHIKKAKKYKHLHWPEAKGMILKKSGLFARIQSLLRGH